MTTNPAILPINVHFIDRIAESVEAYDVSMDEESMLVSQNPMLSGNETYLPQCY